MRRRMGRGFKNAEILVATGFLLAGNLAFTSLTGVQSAKADEEKATVQVIIENTTWSKDDGAPWDGTLTAEVELKDGYTGLNALRDAAEANNLEIVSQESYYGGYYVSEIGGVAEKSAGDYSGWLYTFNTGAANSSIDTYKVEDGTLSDGDIIKFLYSKDGGYDLGFYDGKDASAGVAELTIEGGALSPAYSAETKEYTLAVASGTESVKIFPTAAKGDEELIISSGEKTYKRGAAVPVTDGANITVKTVKTNYDENWNPVTVESALTLTVMEKKVQDASAVSEDLLSLIDSAFTGEGIAYGSEWYLMDLARAGKLSDEKKAAYVTAVKAGVAEKVASTLKGQNPTESARLILALTAIEEDPTDVGGVNLLEGIAGMEDIKAQGVNAAAYALLALDSNKYEVPAVEGKTAVTREALIDYIASSELEVGGFDYTGTAEVADPDMTAMVLYALAPYKTTNEKAGAIIDRCTGILSKLQGDDGSFISWGSANSNSTAQVIVALSALGIDPSKDERFVKNGISALDALTTYYRTGKGAYYVYSSKDPDFYSNYQMAMALNAAARLKKGEPSFFNMTKSDLGGQGATGTHTTIAVVFFMILAGSAAGLAVAGKKRSRV